MKYLAAIFFCALLAGFGLPAQASDQVQAREIARLNNCPPKKIEVYQASVGREASTIYRVTCDLPKAVGASSGPAADGVLISCNESLCSFMHAVAAEGKK